MMDRVQTERKQTAFRLREDLLERLKILANKENRSLNNYVESVLLDVAYHEPNETTIAAMKEAERGTNLETLDVDNFNGFVDSLEAKVK